MMLGRVSPVSGSGTDRSSRTTASLTRLMIVLTAMPLATSPALYPPMPSASTNRPISASEPIISSLCSRTLPVSVSATLDILPRRLTSSRPDGWFRSFPALASWHPAWYTYATIFECGGHLRAGVESRLGGLGQRSIDHGFDAGRQVGSISAQGWMRCFGDLLHQSGHRI